MVVPTSSTYTDTMIQGIVTIYKVLPIFIVLQVVPTVYLYLSGQSVRTNIRLVRTPDNAEILLSHGCYTIFRSE